MGGREWGVYGREVCREEYVGYRSEESEKVEVRGLGEKVGGEMEGGMGEVGEEKEEKK